MLVELVAQPHCVYLLCTEAIKYVYTVNVLFKGTQLQNGTICNVLVHPAEA